MGTAGHEQLIPDHRGVNRTFPLIAIGTIFAITISPVTIVLHILVAITVIRGA